MSLQERLSPLFDENFTILDELGASVAVWENGREVLSLAGGWRDREKTQPWTAETPVLFWSATKGLAAACLLHACQEHGLSLTSRVAEVWPEFAANGKASVTIAQLMSHQAGLPVLSQPVEVWDYAGVVAGLAAEPPHWPLGEGHGYHARTFGFLMDEMVRRVTGGIPLGRYWREQFGEPLGLDLWIGVPPEMVDRVAPVFPARKSPPKGDLFYTAFLTSGSFTARAFTSPRGLHSAAAMNKPETLTSSFPGFGGVGTARGLAKFYAMLANGGELEGRRFFDAHTLNWMSTTLTQGPDRVLLLDTAFSAGFMQDPVGTDGQKIRATFGPSLRAFGHPGAGGSHAFADPDRGLAFAYVMNQMEPGVLPNAKSLRLVDALYADRS
ncbi:serine hydrolase domain-containing protein [Verrucomicrobiota bacterium sgz303538]